MLAVVFIVAAILGGGGGGEREHGNARRRSAKRPAPPPRRPPPRRRRSSAIPAFATANTTRVGGSDPASNAAGVALATYPSTEPSQRPQAVTLVDADDWRSGDRRLGADGSPARRAGPRLRSRRRARADRAGARRARPAGRQGDRGSPGIRDRRGLGARPACEAKRVGAAVAPPARRRSRRCATSCSAAPPKHIVIAPAAEPAFAMPAAAWAARSGDPVLFADEDKLPAPTAAVLKRHPHTPVYVLGPVLGDLLRRGPRDRQDRRPGAPRLRRGPGLQRDRLRPLRRRQLRLEHQRPRPRLRRRPLRRAARRGRRGAALGLGHLGTAAAHRQRRYPSRLRCAGTCSTSSRATRPTRRAPSTTTFG